MWQCWWVWPVSVASGLISFLNHSACWALLADDLRWPGFKFRSGCGFSVGWTNGRYDMRLISRTGTESACVFSKLWQVPPLKLRHYGGIQMCILLLYYYYASPAGFWAHYNIVILTYLQAFTLITLFWSSLSKKLDASDFVHLNESVCSMLEIHKTTAYPLQLDPMVDFTSHLKPVTCISHLCFVLLYDHCSGSSTPHQERSWGGTQA